MCQSRITDPAVVTWDEVLAPFQKLCWPDCWEGRVQREEWCPEDSWELALQLWKSLLCRPPCLALKALEQGMNGDRQGFLRGRSAWSGRALEFERQRYLRRENFALRGDAGNNLIAQRELSKHARSRRTPLGLWHCALKKGWFFAELGQVLFFLCFSSPARVAFRWNQKKKKKKEDPRWCQNQSESCWFGIAIGNGGARLACYTCSWLDVFTVIARRREKNFLLLRSLIEVDDRINISNRSLFKKHDVCHWCTFVKALSKFQRRLAMIKRQPFASSYALSGHGKTKATLSSVELPNVDSADSNAFLLWQILVCVWFGI